MICVQTLRECKRVCVCINHVCILSLERSAYMTDDIDFSLAVFNIKAGRLERCRVNIAE